MDLRTTDPIRRATQLATNITINSLNGVEGDHIYEPDVYVQNSGKSGILNTPLGDKWVQLQPINDSTFVVIEAPIINITRKKSIVKQSISGLDGSIFQITSNGDYNISMKFSFITDKTWKRVDDTFKDYLKAMNIKDKLHIQNALLNEQYDIEYVIIENITESINPTYSNIVDVSLSMSKVVEYNIFDKYIENGSLTINKY